MDGDVVEPDVLDGVAGAPLPIVSSVSAGFFEPRSEKSGGGAALEAPSSSAVDWTGTLARGTAAVVAGCAAPPVSALAFS